MPAVANPTLWRTKPQKVRGYLYIDNPPVVFARRVNQATFNYPLEVVAYDNPDSSSTVYADVVAGMTLKVSDSSGVFKAFLRVRAIGDTYIFFGHVSPGECQFADNDRLEVLDDKRGFAEIPYIEPTGVIRKDWNNYYNGQNLNPPPIANAGVWFAGFVDSVTGEVEVDFTPMTSFAVDDGASISSQAWDLQDGTPSTATTATVADVVYEAGRRWISKTVTDSNGNTHTAWALVATLTPDDVTPVTLASLQGSVDNGWTAKFELAGTSLTAADFPDGAPVIFFTDEKRGATVGSIAGQAGREHVKFCGWIINLDTSANDDGTSDLTITCAGPLAYMKTQPGFDQILERVTTPDNWQAMANLNWWKALIHWLFWHSNLLDFCDIERSPYYDLLPVMFMPAQSGTLANQVQFVAESTWGNFTCDKQGIFYARRWPQTMTSAEKTALATIIALGASDWTGEIRLGRVFRDKVGWLRGYPLLASASVISSIQVIAPGVTPGQGVSQDTVDQRIVVTEAEGEERFGLLYAYRNTDDEPITLKILHMGGVADPAWQEWVTLTLAAASNKRGLSYSAARFWVSQVTMAYDWRNGTSAETWTLEKEVTGAAGTTVPLPNEDDGTTVISQDPPTWTDPPVLIPEVTQTDNTMDELPSGVAVAWGNPTLITTQRQAPGWAVLHDPAGEVSQQVVGDEHCPYYATGRGSLDLFILTDAALYYAEDCLSQAPTITNQAALDDYTILRLVRGVAGGVAVYGPAISTSSGDLTLTFDDPGGTDEDFTANLGSVGAGGRSGDGYLNGTDGANRVINLTIDLGTETTLQAFDIYIYAAYSQATHTVAYEVTGYESDGTTSTGNYQNSSEATTDSSYTLVSLAALNWANTQFIEVNIQNPNFWLSEIRCDDIAMDTTLTGIVAAVRYSSDYGDTGTVLSVGGEPTQGGYDVDDFNLGIHVASNGVLLRHTTTYTGAFANITGVTSATGGVEYNVVRVPYRRPSTNALNNSNTALHVIWGATGLVSSETLWRGTLNETTNAMSNITACTPNDGSEDFAPVGPNSLEVLASNADVWLGVFEGLTSGDRWLCLTEDAGATWDFVQQVDYSHVQWSTVGGLAAWMAGTDGIGRTGDRGTTLSDRTGDAQIISDITTFRGAFSIR